MPRFIKCTFPNSTRPYTYRLDDSNLDVSIGDKVDVTGPHGDIVSVEVAELDVDEPVFACKVIHGFTDPGPASA